VLHQAVALLADRGIEIDLETLPLDDERTYEMLSAAETVGVFQLESSGMRDLIRQAKPSNIEDIIALVALFRPGPMENIPKYVACKNGREDPEFLHETIEPVVADTYGVIIYQEQVMQIAQVFAGYSLGEADLLRRAMGKKIKSEMDAQRARFVDGAVAKGVEPKQAEYVFDLVDKFAGYGFNKSHSACYAVVAYHTAWMKANHPVEFLAASMSLDIHNTDKLNVFKQEAQRLGIELCPPGVNESGAAFTTKDGKVLYALAAIKNVGHQAMEHIVEVRGEGGPFRDVFDFAERINPRFLNRRALENLIRAGALDCLNPDRARLLASVDLLLGLSNRSAQERESQQSSLFGDAAESLERPTLTQAEPWLPMQRLAEEFSAVGFYLSGHPLDDYQKALRRANVVTFGELAGRTSQAERLAGTVTARQERNSKKGNRFAFIGLSDATGQYEAVIFSEELTQYRDLLEPGKAVVIGVEIDRGNGDVRLRIQSVQPVDTVVKDTAAGLRIFVDSPEPFATIKSRLERKGKGRVSLVLLTGATGEVEVQLPQAYEISPQIRGAIKAVPGVVDVQEI